MPWTEFSTDSMRMIAQAILPTVARDVPFFSSGHPSRKWVPPVRGPRGQVFVRGVEVSILRPGTALPLFGHPERVPLRRGRVEGPAFGAFRRVIVSLLAVAACAAAIAQAPPSPSRFVVVLDAAHGGEDLGARLKNENEKAFTLAFSITLRALLSARGFTVVTTRDSDAGVGPDRRAEIADHARPQACLSLHASQTGSGIHLFVSSLASVRDARFLAWKTAQSAWIIRSLSLAGAIDSALSHAGVTVTLGRTALPGIDSMTCPAVAVEIAPDRSSESQAGASLDNADYQSRVAEALAAALVEWRSQAREDLRQ